MAKITIKRPRPAEDRSLPLFLDSKGPLDNYRVYLKARKEWRYYLPGSLEEANRLKDRGGYVEAPECKPHHDLPQDVPWVKMDRAEWSKIQEKKKAAVRNQSGAVDFQE